MSKKKKALAALMALMMVSAAGCGGEESPPTSAPELAPTEPEVVEPAEPEPEPEPIVKTGEATIAATGDILMHYPIIKMGQQGDGTYNFDPVFTYFARYVSEADYAAANLETTLGGLDNGYKYQGYPRFNCPDGIVEGLKTAGFDLLLTANNHTYDTCKVRRKPASPVS